MKIFLRYSLVGVFNTALGYFVIFFLMYVLNFSPYLSNIGGYLFGLIFSYVLNRVFTFKSINRKAMEIPVFLLVFFFAYGLNLIALYILVDLYNVDAGVGQIVSGVVYVIVSFVLQKYFVFGGLFNRLFINYFDHD